MNWMADGLDFICIVESESVKQVRLKHKGHSKGGNNIYSILVEYTSGQTEYLTINSYSKPWPRTRWTKIWAVKNAERWIKEHATTRRSFTV